MTTPQLERLLDAIPRAEETMRFVGGCVRDGLLGKPVQDVDLATSYQPQEIITFLKQANIKFVPTGLAHGTVLAVVDGIPYEITTLRKDIETYGRHAKVEFTDDWIEDAKRRDFTFNSIYLTPHGDLHDPWHGYEDLQAGRVRFIGNARERIKEDYLRILRYFRFYARFSQQKPDTETVSALKELASGLKRISGERIHNEFFRLLSYPELQDTLQLMVDTGVLEESLGLTHVSKQFDQLIEREHKLELAPGIMRRFLSLFLDEPQHLKKSEQRLKLTNKEKKHLNTLLKIVTQDGVSDNWILYHYGADLFQDIILLVPPKTISELRQKLSAAEKWQPQKLPVTGHDLIELGIQHGPQRGSALKQLEEWWIAKNFKPDKAQCLDFLKSNFVSS
jgi:poly(A) polymerase